MIQRTCLTLIICLLLTLLDQKCNAQTAANLLQPFADNTRWAAIGDSITHNGWYAPYVDLYYLTRFPNRKLDVFNCGINGDVADGGLKRYSWDVAPHHPTVASIMFGMNDVGRDDYAAGKTGEQAEKSRLLHINTYERNLRNLVKQLQQDKVEVIIILPTIFDNTAAEKAAQFPGLNDALGECVNRAQKIATDMGCAVIDFYHPMLNITREHQAIKPEFSMIGDDRTHPTVQGHLFMAYEFLKAQNVPSEVAHVWLKGTDAAVLQASNCQVNNSKLEGETLHFQYVANSLPFPIEPMAKAATTWVPFMEDLNQEVIKITDLPSGTYVMAIDGKTIRNYTADELGQGVNLAGEESTPQAQQAMALWAEYKKRQDCVFKLRTIASVERSAFSPNSPHPATLEEVQPLLDAYLKRIEHNPWKKSITKEIDAYRACKANEAQMHEKMDAMMIQIRDMAQPKPHQISISPLPATGVNPPGLVKAP